MPAVGLPDGLHRIGDVEAVVENGIARLPDNTAYAGSVTTMDVCIRNGMDQVDLSLIDVVRMATLTPAEIVGVDDRKGSLVKGKDADIIVCDKDFNVRKTVARGKLVYEKD
jgi:N-acetylglucosamine-6-phosphate deacetylase